MEEISSSDNRQHRQEPKNLTVNRRNRQNLTTNRQSYTPIGTFFKRN